MPTLQGTFQVPVQPGSRTSASTRRKDGVGQKERVLRISSALTRHGARRCWVEAERHLPHVPTAPNFADRGADGRPGVDRDRFPTG